MIDGPVRIDAAVVGAGAAGLYAALVAARAGARVALVSATPLAGSSSWRAQGGLAAALGADDSPDRHRRDTVSAGRGAVRESAAHTLCAEAPAAVADLQALGVAFDRDPEHGAGGELALALEGGHSTRRVVHAGGSATGREITRRLAELAAAHPRVEVLERRRAVALLVAGERCVGVQCDDGRALRAPATVLATGGGAALWARTTNPPGATGAGLLLAHAAGARLADLELVQFHPTAVVATDGVHDRLDGFLITEAVRGEGARLLDAAGERFVDELAPRDEVAQAIKERLRATGEEAVALDMRTIPLAGFGNVVTALRAAGIDPATELVPVAPAAHYTMGGIAVDADGRASLAGLYAVGECACTGLHGANRLASNSLSECFVFGRRAALAALDEPAVGAVEAVPCRPSEPAGPVSADRDALLRDAGIERDAAGLRRLRSADRHALVRLVAACALAREESRGAHRRRDAPALDPALDHRHTIVGADASTTFERWE